MPVDSTITNLEVGFRPRSGCDYIRIQLPFSYLDVKPKPKNKVFIFNRVACTSLQDVIERKKNGVKIICDMDDHFILDDDHYLKKAYDNGMADTLRAHVEIADIVTCSTRHLADKMLPFNRNVEVVPNALPFDRGQFTMSPDVNSQSTFVYVAGSSHLHDLKLIEGVDRHRDITLAGYSPSDDNWNKMRDVMPGARLKGVKENYSYMHLYDGHRCSIAPLRGTPFNACKSNIKVLEAGAKGIPIITSRVAPYFNGVDHERVLYAESIHDWRKHMTRIRTDKYYAREKGMELAEHVREHYQLSKANEIRRQIIESL